MMTLLSVKIQDSFWRRRSILSNMRAVALSLIASFSLLALTMSAMLTQRLLEALMLIGVPSLIRIDTGQMMSEISSQDGARGLTLVVSVSADPLFSKLVGLMRRYPFILKTMMHIIESG